MRPEDEQPTVHEIGNRTFIVAPVEPLDLDGVRTMQVGTALWAIGFVVLFLLRHRLAADDHEWWVGVGRRRLRAGPRRVGAHDASSPPSPAGRAVTRTVYYTATTLDGYIADEHDSLEWLFTQDIDQEGPGGYEPFIAGIGAMAMGATTYEWVRGAPGALRGVLALRPPLLGLHPP